MSQIADLIFLLLNLLTFALIGRALISWFDPGFRWPISQVLFTITEPLLSPIRQIVPQIGFLDLSFIVALVLIRLLQRMLQQALV